MRREPSDAKGDAAKGAMPRFSTGRYEVTASRWFGRGRSLVEEAETGFTAPIIGLLPGETATVSVPDGLLRDAVVEVLDPATISAWRVSPTCDQAEVCPGCAMQWVSRDGRADYARTLVREVLERFGGFETRALPPLVVEMGDEGGHRARTKFWLRARDTPEDADGGAAAHGTTLPRGVAQTPVRAEAGMRRRGDAEAPLVDFARCVANAPELRLAVDVIRRVEISAAQWASWGETSPPLELDWSADTGLSIDASAWPPEAARALIDAIQAPLAAALQRPVSAADATRPWTPVNPAMHTRLYALVASWLQLDGRRVFDLTCGDGSLTFHFAREGAEVFASDRHWEAVQRTEARARVGGYGRVHCRGGDALAVLAGARRRGEAVDLIVINPMREPVGEATMRAAAQSGAEELLYLAPAPKAGAKDLAILRDEGWTLQRVAAVDLHPWTGQLMMAALLAR